MNSIKSRIIYCCVLIVISIALGVIGGFSNNQNIVSFSIILGILSLIKIFKFLKIKNNEELTKKYEIKMTEEREMFIIYKSGYYAFYFLELILAFIVIFEMYMNNSEKVNNYSIVMSIGLVIYIASYFVVSKKY